jgi:hypothetical protein
MIKYTFQFGNAFLIIKTNNDLPIFTLNKIDNLTKYLLNALSKEIAIIEKSKTTIVENAFLKEYLKKLKNYELIDFSTHSGKLYLSPTNLDNDFVLKNYLFAFLLDEISLFLKKEIFEFIIFYKNFTISLLSKKVEISTYGQNIYIENGVYSSFSYLDIDNSNVKFGYTYKNQNASVEKKVMLKGRSCMELQKLMNLKNINTKLSLKDYLFFCFY